MRVQWILRDRFECANAKLDGFSCALFSKGFSNFVNFRAVLAKNENHNTCCLFVFLVHSQPIITELNYHVMFVMYENEINRITDLL